MSLDLGYQAGEGRGQLDPSLRPAPLSCPALETSTIKGGPFSLFGCVYFETLLDDGPGSMGAGLESTWMLSQRWLAPPCRSSDLERLCGSSGSQALSLPTCFMSLAGHF
jgi:hypothetical protein